MHIISVCQGGLTPLSGPFKRKALVPLGTNIRCLACDTPEGQALPWLLHHWQLQPASCLWILPLASAVDAGSLPQAGCHHALLWCHSNTWDQSPSCPPCNSTPSLQAGDAGGLWSQDHILVWLPLRRGNWAVYSSHILFEFAGMWSVFSSSPIVLSLGLQPEF